MKLLPKTKPRKHWLRSKTWKVMKLASILVIALTLQVSAAVSSQTVTFSGKNVAIKKVLTVIKNQTNYVFFYDVTILKNVKPISLNVVNTPIEKVLEKVFADQPITWVIEGKTISFVPKVEKLKESNKSVSAQKQVKGKVVDEKGNSIPGANIIVKGTNISTQTDFDGNFNISVSENNSKLVVSFIGMESQEVAIGNAPLMIVLKETGQKLEEVVVVGYGKQKKVNLTGAVSSITSKSLEDRPLSNVTNALQGTMAGVTVTTTNGQPGKDAGNIRIRGIGTLNNSNPMVVVDGVIASMNEVNPNDIESLTVLKDAASSSIYGSRAANGVVLITTKKGKKGQLQVRYSTYMGKQDVHRLPDFLPSWNQASLYNEARVNEGKSPRWTPDDIEKFKTGADPLHPNTDWLKLFYTQPGFQQNHYMSMNGGDEKTTYMFSLGYFTQEGNVKGTSFEKYSTRFNINSQIAKKLSINANLAYQYAPFSEPVSTYANGGFTGDPSGFSQIVRQINRLSNTVPYKYQNGAYGYVADGSPMAWLESGSYNKTRGNILTGNVGADWELAKNLHFKPNFGYRMNTNERNQFVKDIQYYSGITGEPTKYQGPNNLIVSSDKTTYTNLQAILEYQKDFGANHHLKILAGASKEYQLYNYLAAYRQGFLNNSLTEINAAPKDGQQNEGYSNDWALQSYFGRMNYDYKERYLLEANIRRDGSSRFAEGNRWGVFPSFSAGWNISKEDFFESALDVVNTLKLRGSWGKLGNQNVVGNYPSVATISSNQNYSFNQGLASGIAPTVGSNKDISWEATATTNVGLDATFLNQKLDFSVDYFSKNTTEILLKLPIGGVYGLDAPYQNAGSVSNKGWEFATKYRNSINDFSYNVSANISFIENKITDLKGSGPYISGGTFQQVGFPISSLYGYVAEGIFQTQAEVDAHAAQSGGKIAPGDIKYKDLSGPDGKPDGVIDGYDKKYLGTYFPKVTYGFTMGANWKSFEISLFFQGAAGVKADGGALIGHLGPDVEKPTSVFLDRWTPENPSASFPRAWYSNKQNDPLSTPSSFWVKDASYLRLKNLLVAYNLPETFLKKVGIKNAKIYYSGQNILTFTKFYKWIDPEMGSTGSIYNYPQVLVNTIGFDITF
jgi:TonB-linked SusC/RagA family outer membrane protein